MYTRGARIRRWPGTGGSQQGDVAAHPVPASNQRWPGKLRACANIDTAEASAAWINAGGRSEQRRHHRGSQMRTQRSVRIIHPCSK